MSNSPATREWCGDAGCAKAVEVGDSNATTKINDTSHRANIFPPLFEAGLFNCFDRGSMALASAAPTTLPSVTRLSGSTLTRGFASQPRDWFAFVEKEACY